MLVQRGGRIVLAVYAVRSASTPLTIRTAHRVPRGREQEHTHLAEQREQRASIRKSAHEREGRESGESERAESKSLHQRRSAKSLLDF